MNYDKDLNQMYKEIESLIEETRKRIYRTVNSEMVILYWTIGKTIIGLQEGKSRAEYGRKLLEDLSIMLMSKYGKGFSIINLRRMRKFYELFPIRSSVMTELTWTHYIELLHIKDKNERDFYMNESINSNWDVRTLQRQRKTCLYERLLLNRDDNKKELLPIKGQVIEIGKDLIKDPYILEFLDIGNKYKESDLEKSILNHLKEFMLELGKGYSFIGNQVRIKLNNEEFYIDLVFYNRIINCHVLIDLKVGRITHRDIGQMQSYVSYYDKYIKKDSENETIGILLGTTKNNVAVKLTINESSEVYASLYKLTLPSKEELVKLIKEEKKNCELSV